MLSYTCKEGSKKISKIPHIYLISRTQARAKFKHLTSIFDWKYNGSNNKSSIFLSKDTDYISQKIPLKVAAD